MACEDFPCCGHEAGCCPDYDASGRQLNMICVCGAKLPINNRSSLCDSCLRMPSEGDYPEDNEEDFRDDEEEGEEGQAEPDEQEDFGYFGYEGCHEE